MTLLQGIPGNKGQSGPKEWLAVQDQVSVCRDMKKEEDYEKFFNSFRMTKTHLEELLGSIEERIAKEPVMRQPISARTQLQVQQSILVQ